MSHRHARSGFTLVELLIVITIMGVLVSLLSVAVYNALLTAKRAQITAEINQMDMAMMRLASESGEMYPPDFTLFDRVSAPAYFQADVARFLNKRFPRARTQNLMAQFDGLYSTSSTNPEPPHQQWKEISGDLYDPKRLDPAEALVFWLGGFSVPMTPPQDSTKLRGFSANAANPLEGPLQTKRIPSYYAFAEERLVDRDNDGWYEYIPPGNIGAGNGPPYVYFNSKSYAAQDQSKLPNVRYPKLGAIQTTEWGYATPYRSSEGNLAWVNPKKFQIISAGLDGAFGNTGGPNPGPKDFPMGDRYEIADNDNQSNFTEGTLEQKKP